MVRCFGAILSELYGGGSVSRRHSVRPSLSMPLATLDALKLDARRVTYGKERGVPQYIHRGVVLCVCEVIRELYGSGSAYRRHNVRPAE